MHLAALYLEVVVAALGWESGRRAAWSRNQALVGI